MVKNNSSGISGYTPDIQRDKALLGAYNRHRDSYSVYDLSPEILLISARLSQILLDMSYSDKDLSQMEWEQVIKFVELKRKLIDSAVKREDLLFRQKETERVNTYNISKNNLMAPETWGQGVTEIVKMVSKFLSEDQMSQFLSEIDEMLKTLTAE